MRAALTEREQEMYEALKGLTKWFEGSGSSVNARWERVPREERRSIVVRALSAVAHIEAAQPANDPSPTTLGA